MRTVPIQEWGRDHWSLLAYIETLCVESINGGVGEIDKRRIRCNPKRHPLHAVMLYGDPRTWKPDYGTRLSGFWKTGEEHRGGLGEGNGKTTDPKRQIKSHDDWDCQNDMEAAGLVTVISEANGFVALTDKGREMAARLRAHKSKGGFFATFAIEGAA